MNYQFGAGKLIARPYNANGTLGSPVELGTLQDVSVDFKVNTKKLMGPYRYAVATADADGDIPFTAKSALFYANAFNLLWGATPTTGAQSPIFDEVGTVAAAKYTVQNATTFVQGSEVVWFTPSGGGLTRQMSVVAAGSEVSGVSYSEGAGGVLNFAATDNGGVVRVTYRVSNTSSGQTFVIANPLQATSLGVRCSLYEQTMNKQNNKPSTFILDLNMCLISGVKLDFKQGDWTVPDFTMDVQADANNQIGTAYFYNYDY